MRGWMRAFPLVGVLSLGASASSSRSSECSHPPASDAPAAGANDNRKPAGTLQDGVLTLRLVMQPATWYPEGPAGCGVPIFAFAEEGKASQTPAPLIRVAAGTEVRVTVRNSLGEPISVWGLRDARRSADESLASVTVPPDSARTFAFRATVPGTYYYWASSPQIAPPVPTAQIFSQAVGGLIVDAPNDAAGAAGERILVMTRWRGLRGPAGAFARERNWELTAFNGLSWPHTERLTATVGDTVRWRVLAANNDGHNMHLHGFYFVVESKGGPALDSIFAPADQRLMVSEIMGPGQTMKLRWIPERPGNWIFHCHLMRHMGPNQRLDRMPRPNATPAEPDPTHASHAMHEMAGLVLGITVRPRGADRPNAEKRWRTMHVFANQRDSVFGDRPGYGFVLQEGAKPPAPDSFRIPGSVLVLRRGEPTQIVVHNRLRKALSVHWHGIELESFSDGVAGWSGTVGSIAPPIVPGDSFVARMTPPRAGTFIYHVHNEHGRELVSGLYGALLVLEPGDTPDLDRVFVIAEPGPNGPAIDGVRPFVNGTTSPPPQELVVGRTHRFRLIVISANAFHWVEMRQDSAVFPWRLVARDGADLPPTQVGRQANARDAPQPVGPAAAGAPVMGAGSTRDYEVTPTAPGTLTLAVDAFAQNGRRVLQPTLVTFHVRAATERGRSQPGAAAHRTVELAALRNDRYAGTWQGRMLNRSRDSVLGTWTWTQGSDSTGSLLFAGEQAPFPTRIVSATPDSVVFDLLIPLDEPEGAMLRFAAAARGDSIAGTVFVRLRDGRTGRRPLDGARVSQLPRFERVECPFQPPAWATGERLECGWLVVPEVRSKPTGRTVRLAVGRLRAATPSGKPPLVMIHGGPGGSGVGPLPGARPGAPPSAPPPIAALAEERDLVLYDQRASGLSQPALCPEFGDSLTANRHRLTRATGSELRKPWIRACVASLRSQGIEPDAYTTTASAMDLADLRRALGYARWDLNGSSYGTRLALEAMRTDPLGIRAAVLVGPRPPGPVNILRAQLVFQRTLDRLFAACAADAACHETFPDPHGDFLAIHEQLRREPLRVPLPNGRDTVVLHADRFTSGINEMLAGPQFPRIPLMLHELRRGDRLRAARALVPSVDPQSGGIAHALANLVNCHESTGVMPQRVADSLTALLLPPFRRNVGTAECALWRTTFAAERERAPVHSDIPTLILTGEFDARTPTDDGRLIARMLTRAFLYEFTAQAHSGGSPCKRDITRQFLEEPTREPDASCIARMPKVSFPTSWPAS